MRFETNKQQSALAQSSSLQARLKYSDAIEERCDRTKIEPRRRGPTTAGRLSSRADLSKERLAGERHSRIQRLAWNACKCHFSMRYGSRGKYVTSRSIMYVVVWRGGVKGFEGEARPLWRGSPHSPCRATQTWTHLISRMERRKAMSASPFLQVGESLRWSRKRRASESECADTGVEEVRALFSRHQLPTPQAILGSLATQLAIPSWPKVLQRNPWNIFFSNNFCKYHPCKNYYLFNSENN